MKKYRYTVAGRVMLGDLHTPVSTYLKVRDIFPQSALMESCDYHGSEDNRSSGSGPWRTSPCVTARRSSNFRTAAARNIP